MPQLLVETAVLLGIFNEKLQSYRTDSTVVVVVQSEVYSQRALQQ